MPVDELRRELARGWDRFWFTPSDAATLAIIRIATGAMLLYTHLVWTVDFSGFLGAGGRVAPEFVEGYYRTPFAWS